MLKKIFAQRMANRAFADGNRVGISLAKMGSIKNNASGIITRCVRMYISS